MSRGCASFLALALAVAGVPAAAQVQMSGGGGQVLDTTTERPVAGATVTLECRRSRLGEGSVEVREVRTLSDDEGRYEFGLLQVLGCDFAYVRASKAGYVDADSIAVRYAQRSYDRIPKYRYLTPEEDAVMLRLTAITPVRTGNVVGLDGSPARVAEYRHWYEGFFQAKDIARTERERRFVRERYCETLRALHGALNEQERMEAARIAVFYHWRGIFRRQDRHDYVVDVQAWCAQ